MQKNIDKTVETLNVSDEIDCDKGPLSH